MTVSYYFWIVFILIKSTLFESSPRLFSIKGFAQGTTYQVKYLAVDSIVTQDKIDSILGRIDLSLSLYKENSLISRFNRAYREIEMDSHMRKVIEISLHTYKITGGAFDISVKPLVDLWGFGPKGFSSLPADTSVNRLKSCVGSDFLKITGNKLFKVKPCVQIDCNGIGQGYSVDVLSEFLSANKIQNYLVEIGGEVRVNGMNDKSNKWAIGAEKPSEFEEGSFVPFILRLSEGAVTTSGNYRRVYSIGAKNYHHIIDPNTGYPSDNNLVSVSVIAKNAVTADALDNAFMVMGLENAFRFLENRSDLEAYFMFRKNDGKLADTATKGFYNLMENLSANGDQNQ